jgi:phosphoenolpyruvate carboxykinase (ATP)
MLFFKKGTNEVDFEDVSITPNTRVSYPIYHIDTFNRVLLEKSQKHIFLTADSFGILPPFQN